MSCRQDADFRLGGGVVPAGGSIGSSSRHTESIPGAGVRVPERSRHARRQAGEADRYPCGLGLPRRRPRAEGQARGALSVSGLFDARAAQGRVRDGADRQPAVRARNLPAGRRRSRARRTALSRIAGDGEPVEWAVEMRRFDETATLDHLRGRRPDRRRARRYARPDGRGRACAPPRRSRPSPGSRRSATISNRTTRRSARCRRCFRLPRSTP